MDESNLRSTKRKSSPRSSLNIDHGSSDYKNDSNGGFLSRDSSNGSFGSVNLTNHGNNLDSPGGLHHRHPHRANLSSDGSKGGSFSFQRGRAAPKSPLLPNPPSNSKLSALKNKQSSSTSFSWIFVPSLVIIYFMFMYAHQHYFQEESYQRHEKEGYHQTERLKEMKHARVSEDSLSRDKSSLHNEKPNHSPNTIYRRGQDVHNSNYISQRDNSNKDASSNFLPFAFDAKRQTRYEQPTESIPAYERAHQWAQPHLDNAVEATKKRRAQRVKLTSGPNNNLSNLDMESIGAVKTRSGVIPLWYELNHMTKETMVSLRQRWNEDDSLSNSASNANDYADTDFQLCGLHANQAAQHYPQNYYPSDSTTAFNSHHAPLGPNSRVLITGILSPLGMHLAIALSRQCNVTNFLGIDTQIPNDPLSRLEQEERLAVLMEELDDLKQLQVPFLGVEGKQRGKRSSRQDSESRAREEALMNIFLKGSSDELTEKYSNLPTEYKLPKDKLGIPLSPGIHPSGFGPLEILLEYRPTHVVHLAGTQSDSFLSAKSADYVYPFASQDEDEVILKESISSKPHLYELRMASTGMEQLLSAVVAQSMIPPRFGRDEDNSEDNKGPKEISRSDLNKMKRPHFVYASSYDAHYFGDLSSRVIEKAGMGVAKAGEDGAVDGKGDEGNEGLGSPLSPQSLQRPPRGLKGVSSLIDEVLASTYYALHGVPSVGLRFDAIYGPRGFGVPSTSVPIYNVRRIRRGGVGSDVDLAETAVRRLYRNWVEVVKKENDGENGEVDKKPAAPAAVPLSLIEEAGWSHAAHDPRDFVYVEDAVGAIIAAMQYRAVGGSPSTFNIGSGEMSHLSFLAEEIEQLSSDDSVGANEKHSASKSVIDVEQSSAARSASLDSKEYLQWSSTTTLQDGAAHLLAWHLDRALPFFPPSTSTDGHQPLDGEDILSRRGIVACSDRDNPTCLREAHTYLPCSSECATKTCSASVFDGVLDLSREVTEDCDAVLYTVSLGYDVKKLNIQTKYSDGEEQRKNGDPSLCTIAFVPTESRLVEQVIAKIPAGSLSKMHLDLSEDSDYETKLKKLSGHLVHQGWLLIFVDGATDVLSAEDIFVPKLSPRRLFHPSVRRAMFVDENFSSTPLPEDALFLTSEMSRGKIKKRTVIGPNERGKKIKYKLPEEPPRTAVLMVAPARDLPKVDLHHMPLKEITKHLIKEVGGNEDDPEPKNVRTQREFYERARSLINSFDLRSLDNIARHRIQIKDFIRSRWVLHDLREEEGHQLRCEWYQEHVRWNTHLDQLSFAYVMAKRELTRKVITEQPLQTEVEKVTLLQIVIDAKSDAKEWHPIFSGEGTILPIHFSQIAPEAIPQNLEDQHEITEETPAAATDDGNTFYVRIISDPRMMEARKEWVRARKEARKKKG